MAGALKKKATAIPIEGLIHAVRGMKVMMDSDLARLYGVETKILNQAVHRNLQRFPQDFMFQLSQTESESLRSQIVTSNAGRGGRRYLPYAFTEHGVVMLSSVLKSERAIRMNILVVRAFVRMRAVAASHNDLASRVAVLERGREKTNSVMEVLIEDIDRLARDVHWIKNPPLPKKHRMGFFVEKDVKK